MAELFSSFAFTSITWQMAVMWAIGGTLIYLAIKKEMEPTLLLPMGFGAILVNLPLNGALGDLETLVHGFRSHGCGGTRRNAGRTRTAPRRPPRGG